MAADHFTAVVQIEAVTEEIRATGSGYSEQQKASPRKVQEVAKLVLRGNSLEQLKEKLQAHIALVEED